MDKVCDLQGFTQFFNDYRSRFTHFAYSYVGDKMAAEDIVLESLMSYWENRSTIHPDSNTRAYVLTIVKNRCLNYLNHQRVRQSAEEYLLKAEEWELDLHINSLKAFEPDQVFSEEIQQIVEDTLNKLPEQTRLIFIKSRYENYSHKQIAEEMGLSTKSVEFHITKALKVLRIALKDYFPAFLWYVFFN
ncbi:MAG: RNA polymerase sigma-70 factor [Tannerella sp.]|jgi:RNA polymerase sigma-70 factor (ECF subfamily)|nr:RNA polymerase sigma-70 factor [Tannerella sp.]